MSEERPERARRMSVGLCARDAVAHALEAARRAGALAADAVAVESDSVQVRVRDAEIEHVKQARERGLGLRVFVDGGGGRSSALTSTSDLTPEVVERMAAETVTLARATAPDPHAGLPEGGFVADAPELGLLDPADRAATLPAQIARAREAEAAARGADPRITNSEGSEASSDFARVAFGNSAGLHAEYESAHHGISCMPVARDGAGMQTDHWASVGRRLADLEAPADVGREAARRALARLGAQRVQTTEGEAEVVRVLNRVTGGRLLELRLSERPTPPFFAASRIHAPPWPEKHRCRPSRRPLRRRGPDRRRAALSRSRSARGSASRPGRCSSCRR